MIILDFSTIKINVLLQLISVSHLLLLLLCFYLCVCVVCVVCVSSNEDSSSFLHWAYGNLTGNTPINQLIIIINMDYTVHHASKI